MAKKNKPYKRLPGRHRNAFGYNTLWQGPDHVLHVESRGYSEEYKRFYYRDIQSVVIRKTIHGTVFSIMTGVLLLVFGGLTYNAGYGGRFFFGFIEVFMFIAFIVNLALGSTCVTHINTAVHNHVLPSLNRLPTARKALKLIKQRVEEVQGEHFIKKQYPGIFMERSRQRND